MTRSARARQIALAFVLLCGASAWGAGIFRRFFDYDEIYHAHASWLIAQGGIPFHDFQASHSPFLWYPMAALWRVLPNSPETLIPLRIVASVGTAASVVVMAAAFGAIWAEIPVVWLAVGVALVAFERSVLDYSVELRPDSWSTALLFLGFWVLLTKKTSSTWSRCALFGALCSAAVLTSPKFFLLPVIFAAVDLVDRARRRDDATTALIGYALGAAAAVLVALAVLRAARIDPALAYQMAIGYQLAFVGNTAFHRGLLDSVTRLPYLSALVAIGICSWAIYLFIERRRPFVFEIAVLLFLAAQLLIVDRPYKQYYGPWFLLASCFVPYAGVLSERLLKNRAAWCFRVAIVIGALTALDGLRWLSGRDRAHQMLAFYDAMARLSPPDAPIVAFPPLHPVIRRDVFYGWSRTTDPGGNGTEAIMRKLDVPGYSERFDREHYRQELDSRPPGLVVSPLEGESAYEPLQWAVLREYLTAHQGSYVLDETLIRPVWIRQGH